MSKSNKRRNEKSIGTASNREEIGKTSENIEDELKQRDEDMERNKITRRKRLTCVATVLWWTYRVLRSRPSDVGGRKHLVFLM